MSQVNEQQQQQFLQQLQQKKIYIDSIALCPGLLVIKNKRISLRNHSQRQYCSARQSASPGSLVHRICPGFHMVKGK